MANEVTLFQVNPVNDFSADTEVVGGTTYTNGACPFTVGPSGCELVKIKARLAKQNNPTDYLVAKLYSNDSTSNEPLSLLDTSDQQQPDTTYDEHTFNFSGAYILVPDTVYWIVIERTGTLDNVNNWDWAVGTACQHLYDIKYIDGVSSEWTNHAPANNVFYMKIVGQHSNLEELVNYNYEYDAYYNFALSNTYWGIAQKIITPSNITGNNYRIECIGAGFGGADVSGNWGCTSGDCDIYCEIHTISASLDLTDNSTTRVGSKSLGVDRNFRNVTSDNYTITSTKNWVWSTGDWPELSPNTEYYIVWTPNVTLGGSGGTWRVGQDDQNPKGDNRLMYGVSNIGTLTQTGAGEVHENFFIIGREILPINIDLILRWPIIELDRIPLNNDFILPYYLFQYHLNSDEILKWNIQISADHLLRYGLVLNLAQDNDLRWKILLEAQYDFILNWNILVSQDFILPWTLRPLISQDWILPIPIFMSTNTILKWGLNTQLYQDSIFRWIIDNHVWQDIALKYHIKVETDHIILIPLRQQINKDFTLKSHLLSDISVDNTLRFKIREFNQVDSDNKLRWVLEGIPRIYKIIFE